MSHNLGGLPKKKKKKKGLSTGVKIALGIGGLSLAAIGGTAYQISQSGAGKMMSRNAANRSRYKVQKRGRWN